MSKYLVLILLILITSCVYYGSGIRTVTGTVTGGSNVKVGVFPSTVIFYPDTFVPAGDPDVVYSDNLYNTDGIFTPVDFVSPSGGAYSIILPEDPSLINNLIAWDDTNNDNIYDMPAEAAYFPVKAINGTDYVIKYFTNIEVTEEITYIVNYGDHYDDNFDAIGADGFNFTFD